MTQTNEKQIKETKKKEENKKIKNKIIIIPVNFYQDFISLLNKPWSLYSF